MAHINCVVDTQPMAHEIKSVSSHIEGTTAAVVGMKLAVVQAEKAAADKVCEDVNRGFYTLIHSQISQKIARLQSEVDSHLMKLNQLRRQLFAIKSRMERDYGMITSRYVKLFNGLNKNLRQRVTELDKPVIEFAVRDTARIDSRKKTLTATVPVAQTEDLALSQKIIASNMKYRGLRVIDAMRHFLEDMKQQDELTGRMLLDNRTSVAETPVMMPVMFCESCCDRSGNLQVRVYMPDSGLTNNAQTAVRNRIMAAGENLEWSDTGQADNDVQIEFNRLLESGDIPQRVKETAARLFERNRFKTLKM